MTNNLRLFLIAFLAGALFVWGINILEGNLKYFYFPNNYYQANFTAEVGQNRQIEPEIKNTELSPNKAEGETLKIEAEAAMSIWVSSGNKEAQKILFEKSASRQQSIASLSKIMSAFIILKYYDTSQEVQFSLKAAEQSAERFKAGESFRTENLLYSSLLESDNGAALAMAEIIGENGFVELMNLETNDLGLKDTLFINPTGLDEEGSENANYSTANDLSLLVMYLLKERPDLWKILSRPEFDLTDSSGVFHHKVLNTNELLTEPSDWRDNIVGGKTGWTPMAKGCLLLVLKSPDGKGYIINIILGSEDRFGEMKKLVNWAYQTYSH